MKSIVTEMKNLPLSTPKGGSDGSVCLQCKRPGFNPWVRKIPWRRKWQITPVVLPGESHGWRSLVGLQSTGSWRVGHDWVTSVSLSGRLWASPMAQWVKNLPAVQETQEHGFNPWVRRIPWRKIWQPTPIFLLKIPWTEEHGGLQSMTWKESDRIEWLSTQVDGIWLKKESQNLRM